MLREEGQSVARRTPPCWQSWRWLDAGASDFKNDPRPPVPAEVTVKIATDGVAVSPREFGAGLVNFTVANLTNETGSLAIQGPVDATSNEIAAGGRRHAQGRHEDRQLRGQRRTASRCAPFGFTVGPERPSGKNDLLLP